MSQLKGVTRLKFWLNGLKRITFLFVQDKPQELSKMLKWVKKQSNTGIWEEGNEYFPTKNLMCTIKMWCMVALHVLRSPRWKIYSTQQRPKKHWILGLFKLVKKLKFQGRISTDITKKLGLNASEMVKAPLLWPRNSNQTTDTPLRILYVRWLHF